MITAINIRGTGGSGKSTLARRVMELYAHHNPVTVEGRKQPLFTCHWGNPRTEEQPHGLVVPGHYNTDCGGCDTLKTVDSVYDIVRQHTLGDPPGARNNVLYEGIMVMDDVTRAVKFSQDLEKVGGRLIVIALSTTIEECLASIRARRGPEMEAKKPLNEKNTRDRAKRQEKILHRLKQAGVKVEKLSRDEAFIRCRELLGI